MLFYRVRQNEEEALSDFLDIEGARLSACIQERTCLLKGFIVLMVQKIKRPNNGPLLVARQECLKKILLIPKMHITKNPHIRVVRWREDVM